MRVLGAINRKRGSAVAEFGPALILILLFLFFPLMDLVMVGLTYFSCTTLVDLQADKAKLLPASMAKDESGPVKKDVVQLWQTSGVGAFAKLASPPLSDVSYTNIDGNEYVVVSTTCAAAPFMTIPFLPGIPGISAPANFRLSCKRLLEDPSNLAR